MTFRFPSDSPESKARLARAIARERAASAPKTTKGTDFERYLQEIGHPAVPTCSEERPCVHCYSGQGKCLGPAAPPQSPPAQKQEDAAGLKAGDLVMVWSIPENKYVPREFKAARGTWIETNPLPNEGVSASWGNWRLPTPAERAQVEGWLEHDGSDEPRLPVGSMFEYKGLRNDSVNPVRVEKGQSWAGVRLYRLVTQP